jgi:hypothetical protein
MYNWGSLQSNQWSLRIRLKHEQSMDKNNTTGSTGGAGPDSVSIAPEFTRVL